MKTLLPLTTAFVVFLATSTPGRAAGLIIERLVIESRAGGVIHTSDPFTPLGIPPFVTATSVNGDVQALSLQTKDGFFRNSADINRGSFGDPAITEASSFFYLVVGTDTINTPLVLDFHFLGAQTKASSYFRFGDIDARVFQTIQAERRSSLPPATAYSGDLTNVWGFAAGVSLKNGLWSDYYTAWDTKTNGVPAQTITPLIGLDAEGNTNSFGRVNDLAPFHGTLDFGLLQPGEFFALRYEATAEVRSFDAYDIGPDAYANALLVDPFSLGGTPPAQLSMQGLTLPALPSTGPKLAIALAGLQQFRLSWPTNAPEYALECATNLSASVWTTLTNTPTVVSNQFAVVVDTTVGAAFYRLRKP